MIYVGPAMLAAIAAWSIWDSIRLYRRINALRHNCFLTDEKGHRRRYADCSADVQARAETN